MRSILHSCVVAICLLAPVRAQLPACPDSDAQPEMVEGEGAYLRGHYAKAAAHFQSAVALDPACVNARVYLANAYMQQYVPGADAPENLALANKAREQFEKVLEQQPENQTAMLSIASLYFNQKKLDEAKAWYEKLTVLNPQRKDAFYTLGVIAWTRSYSPCQEARAKSGMKPQDAGPLKDAEARQALRAKYLPVIQEGMDNLNTALEIDEYYDDAMAYLNLLFRLQADLENSPEDYQAAIAKADEWTQKAIETKKNKTPSPR